MPSAKWALSRSLCAAPHRPNSQPFHKGPTATDRSACQSPCPHWCETTFGRPSNNSRWLFLCGFLNASGRLTHRAWQQLSLSGVRMRRGGSLGNPEKQDWPPPKPIAQTPLSLTGQGIDVIGLPLFLLPLPATQRTASTASQAPSVGTLSHPSCAHAAPRQHLTSWA
jgi:hypothetical protein